MIKYIKSEYDICPYLGNVTIGFDMPVNIDGIATFHKFNRVLFGDGSCYEYIGVNNDYSLHLNELDMIIIDYKALDITTCNCNTFVVVKNKNEIEYFSAYIFDYIDRILRNSVPIGVLIGPEIDIASKVIMNIHINYTGYII